MTSIVAYQKVSDAHTSYELRIPVPPDQVDSEPGITELCTIDGITYVALPDWAVLPDDPAATPVELTDELRDAIKAASPHCRLIHERMEARIRERYSIADEQYFARIGVGKALGVYEFEPGEQDELLAFGVYVEGIREWGRAERAKLGL